VPSHVFLHGDGFSRAYVGAETAALTGDSINIEVLYRRESALFLAQSTLITLFPINDSDLPAPELMLLPDSRLKQEMKGSGVYIAIHQHLVLRQSRERADDTGLSGASFTA
jgi:hypothetical protein